MAKLTDEESAVLKRLQDKQKAPDEPQVGRSLNITLDLGNEKAVALARKMGLVPPEDEGGGEGGEGGGEGGEGGGEGGEGGGGGEPPRRGGFFGDR